MNTLSIFIILFLVEVIWAFVLSRKNWYIPDWTWVPVLVWGLFVVSAMYVIALGQPDRTAVDMAHLFALAMFVAALPMIIWLVIARDRRIKQRAAKRGE